MVSGGEAIHALEAATVVVSVGNQSVHAAPTESIFTGLRL